MKVVRIRENILLERNVCEFYFAGLPPLECEPFYIGKNEDPHYLRCGASTASWQKQILCAHGLDVMCVSNWKRHITDRRISANNLRRREHMTEPRTVPYRIRLRT